MKATILLVFVFAVGVFAGLRSDEELARETVVVENDPGHKLRAYEAEVFPKVGPVRAVQVKGIALEKDKNHGTIDAVEFDINTWGQMALAFGYFHAEGDVPNNANATASGTATASAFAFLLRAFYIFEYDEKNGVDGYQKDGDTINSYYDLSSIFLPWKPLVANQSEVTASDGTTFKVWYISAETLDEVFFIRFIVAGTPLDVAGAHITPDSVKVDFRIRWFTPKHVANAGWTQGPSNATAHPNAHVCIASAMAALAERADASTGTQATTPSVTFGAGGFQGFFSWAPSADVTVQGVERAGVVTADIVTNNDANVQAAFQAGWIIRGMFFSFEGDRPSDVAWDPSFGSNISYNSAVSSCSVNFVIVAFFALLVLFA